MEDADDEPPLGEEEKVYPENRRLHIKVRPEDGALARQKLEHYAILLADGLDAPVAWRLAGHQGKGGTNNYRRQVEADQIFKGRLRVLLAEKERCDADPIFGDAKWMALQMWREARMSNNLALLQAAAAMRWKITERELAFKEAEAPPPGDSKRAPGRPAAESPGNAGVSGAAEMRDVLIGMGVAPPAAPEA